MFVVHILIYLISDCKTSVEFKNIIMPLLIKYVFNQCCFNQSNVLRCNTLHIYAIGFFQPSTVIFTHIGNWHTVISWVVVKMCEPIYLLQTGLRDTLHQQTALCAATPYVIIPARPIVTLCFYTYFATIDQGHTVLMI